MKEMKGICVYTLITLFSLLIAPTGTLAQLSQEPGKSLERVKALIRDFDKLYVGEPVKARSLINQALFTSKNRGFLKEQAESYYRLGKLHLHTSLYDSARINIEMALALYRSMKDVEGVSLCYKDLGTAMVEAGRNEKALAYYTRGLSLAKANELNELVPKLINNIGLIYLQQEYFEKAQEHFKESASLSKSGTEYATALHNVGVVKQKQGRYYEAIDYYRKSLLACEAAEDVYCRLTPMNGLAGAYLHLQELDLALEITEGAVIVQKKLGMGKDMMISFNRMGLIYNQKQDYSKAIEYYEKSLQVAQELQSGLIPYIYANLSDTYANNGQFEKALQYSVRFYQMKDSIYSLEYKVRTEELLAKYEAEKKEKQIALLKKDQRLKEIELEKNQALLKRELLDRELKEQQNKYKLLQRNQEIEFLKKDKALQEARIKNKQDELDRQTFIRNITIVSAILIFIPTFILMVVYQQKVRNRELLAIKTEEINKQKSLEMLRSFEIKTIRASIEGQEKEKQRISRELHDGVAGTLAGIKMRFQTLGKVLNEHEQLKKLTRSIDEVYHEVRTISHHLSPPGLMQYSFVDFIKKYLNEIASSPGFKIEYFFYGEIHLNELTDEIKVEVYRILQELISNVVKHALANFAEVQLQANEDTVNLMVEDRGKGFNPAFNKGGFGLASLRSRVDALGGEFSIDTQPGRGTIVNVNIPVGQKLALTLQEINPH